MNIQTIASSSKGNCYTLNGEIMLECGLAIAKIKKGTGYRLGDIQGCLCSHSHGDHAKAAQEVMKAGIDLYCSAETAQALDLDSHRLKLIEAKKQFNVGDYQILPFDTVHDAPGSLGFLVSYGNDKVLYINDSLYCKYSFRGLTYIMIGVNYDTGILRENVRKELIGPALANRILANHMSLQTAVKFFKSMDLSKLREVHLLHLSDSNSDETIFKNTIAGIVGCPVYVARQLCRTAGRRQ